MTYFNNDYNNIIYVGILLKMILWLYIIYPDGSLLDVDYKVDPGFFFHVMFYEK